MLRASVEKQAGEDLTAITEGGASRALDVVPHAAELVRFADAVLGDDAAELEAARSALRAVLSDAEFVDAAAVVGNFQRMVRIADGTGIPLDAPLEIMTQDLRSDLGLEAFGSSRNTAGVGRVRRAVGHLMRPLVLGTLRRLGGGK